MSGVRYNPDPTRGARGARYRDRRRHGRLVVGIEVAPGTCQALSALGFIDMAEARDKQAVADAVQRSLASVPAVAALGRALYPADDPDDGVVELTPCAREEIARTACA